MTDATLPNHWPVESDWTDQLTDALRSDWFLSLSEFIDREREKQTIFPPQDEVFAAFEMTSYADTKVVILGQDPYHGAGQGHGLSFSVKDGIKHPPSLRNIFKELNEDLGVQTPESGSLSHWARQGVLLLNTVLTVREAEAHSHKKQGWEKLTDNVIRSLNNHPNKLVFILWGAPAQKMGKLIDSRHCLIESPHPSPLSAHRGFFGSKPFSRANKSLGDSGLAPIQW